MRKVLVLDDEPAIRRSLTCFLEDFEFEVLAAETGEDGLALLASHCPDAAIVDMRLPGISGEGFILEAAKLCPGCCFLIHAGSSDYALTEALVDVGLSDAHVLYKPLPSLHVILEKLRVLLEEA